MQVTCAVTSGSLSWKNRQHDHQQQTRQAAADSSGRHVSGMVYTGCVFPSPTDCDIVQRPEDVRDSSTLFTTAGAVIQRPEDVRDSSTSVTTTCRSTAKAPSPDNHTRSGLDTKELSVQQNEPITYHCRPARRWTMRPLPHCPAPLSPFTAHSRVDDDRSGGSRQRCQRVKSSVDVRAASSRLDDSATPTYWSPLRKLLPPPPACKPSLVHFTFF